jgi:pimeloyl-ACP methyl ester carboxylesterase
VLVDRRGTGMSDGPTPARPVELRDWVVDCAAVLDAVGCSAVLVLAHEHGGPVAVALAASDARVRGVLLHSTAARPLRGPEYPHGAGAEDLDRVDRMLDRPPGTSGTLRVVAPSAGDDPALEAWLQRAGQLGAGPARARELHRMYLHSDVRHLLADVGCPVTIVHPARSAVVDPAHASYLARHLADARLVLLDSADHLFWLADSTRVVEEVDHLAERAGCSAAGLRLAAIVAARTTDLEQLHGGPVPSEVTVAGEVAIATFPSLADALLAGRAAAAAGLSVSVHAGDVASGLRGDAVDEAVRTALAAPAGQLVATDAVAAIVRQPASVRMC